MREGKAVHGFQGGNGGGEGDASQEENPGAKPRDCFWNCVAGVQEGQAEFLV